MRFRASAVLASALTISVGLIVILGLLLPEDLEYIGFRDVVQDTTSVLLQLVTITIALTIVLGVLNLLGVHIGRIFRRREASTASPLAALYSLVLLLSFALVVVSYARDRETSMILLEKVQFPVEAALAGLLLFALVAGAFRMMRERVTWSATLFIVTLLLVLLSALPATNGETVQDVYEWLLDIPVTAGARGLLMGIALATLVTGVRVLIGIDRSYRE
jgi:hypothetical protein